ncbi:Receptor-like protein 18 [Cardamine amara subsp. amara]|uniref:Receptor-like protein 18 n=1 Tax=Cardamine amara subsp. amara TaxID=228776 RepID=A0ABD0ZTW0_CARAN
MHAIASQQSEMREPEDHGEEEVIDWKAAAIGFIPGIVFGLTLGYILVCYKTEWFMNPYGGDKRRSISTTH